MIIECEYLESHTHEFPEDWVFGGADGLHPAADTRWEATVYVYYDSQMGHLHTTVAPLCDEQALDEFTKVASWGRGYSPSYLTAKRPGIKEVDLLPWEYKKSNDTLYPLGGG